MPGPRKDHPGGTRDEADHAHLEARVAALEIQLEALVKHPNIASMLGPTTLATMGVPRPESQEAN